MTLAQQSSSVTPLPQTTPTASTLMNEELEMALLGGLLMNGAAFASVMHLTTDAFALPKNKRLWSAMASLHERGIEINLETVRAEIGAISQEGEKHFADLLGMAGDRAASYSKFLQEIETLRLFETNLLQSLTITRNRKLSLSQKMDHISGLVTDVLIKASSLTGPASTSIGQMSKDFHDTYLQEDITGTGIDTGYPDLNALMNGFDRRRMYVLGAETGGGKSMLAQNIAFNLNAQGYRGAFLSLELPIEEYRDRGLASETRIDINRMKQRCITTQEMTLLAEAVTRMNTRGPLHMVYLNKPTLTQLKAKITELHAQPGIDFVVIDYIEARMFTPATKEHMNNPVSFMGAISKDLIDMAKALNLIVFPLVQTTRASFQRGGKPTKEDLSGSASLGRDADMIAILKDESPFSVSMGFGETHLHIVKSRTGGEGEIVRFEARKNVFTFSTWRGL